MTDVNDKRAEDVDMKEMIKGCEMLRACCLQLQSLYLDLPLQRRFHVLARASRLAT